PDVARSAPDRRLLRRDRYVPTSRVTTALNAHAGDVPIYDQPRIDQRRREDVQRPHLLSSHSFRAVTSLASAPARFLVLPARAAACSASFTGGEACVVRGQPNERAFDRWQDVADLQSADGSPLDQTTDH